jgi:two-component system sensor histidine kinase AtoS
LLEVDRELLTQVLLNLVMNSIQAMPKGGQLTVTISETMDHAEIEVADTGFGMSAETLKVVGTPFYTTKETGHGLGISFCKTIASLHNGDLSIESSEGHGTKVLLRISKDLKAEESINA